MKKKKVFISFDYDNDKDIKGCLAHQCQDLDFCPFDIVDLSLTKAIDEKWKKEVRERIKKCDCVVFLCGEHSSQAKGMAAEFSITREEKKPYFLLKGRRNNHVEKPLNSDKNDNIYPWRWNTLKRLLEGERKF